MGVVTVSSCIGEPLTSHISEEGVVNRASLVARELIVAFVCHESMTIDRLDTKRRGRAYRRNAGRIGVVSVIRRSRERNDFATHAGSSHPNAPSPRTTTDQEPTPTI